jgi:hypothetical protein
MPTLCSGKVCQFGISGYYLSFFVSNFLLRWFAKETDFISFCTLVIVITNKYTHTLYYYSILSHPKLIPFWSVTDRGTTFFTPCSLFYLFFPLSVWGPTRRCNSTGLAEFWGGWPIEQDEPLPPYPQQLCPISPWQHLPWPQIMVPRLPTSLLQAPGGGFTLAAAGSLGWDAKSRCIKK